MISLDWTLLVQIAIFLSFVAYLNAFLLRPMGQYLERRKNTIASLRSSGGDSDTELETIQAEYSRKITAVREELLAQRSSARKEMVDIQNSLLDEARKDSHRELSRAEDELDREVAAARDALGQQARALASEISTKVMGRPLS